MLLVYTFVFGLVFKTRWNPGGSDSMLEFAVVLFSGLLVFGIFSENINRAPGLMLQNPGFIKRVVFPLEGLPWVVMCSSLFHAAISLIVLAAVMLVVMGSLPATWPLFLVVLLPLLLFVIGFSWALAALGVYLRDLQQTINIVTAVMMFMSPIFYPATAVPKDFRWVIDWNPMTFFVAGAQAARWGIYLTLRVAARFWRGSSSHFGLAPSSTHASGSLMSDPRPRRGHREELRPSNLRDR
jgi:lipopolysaccharide transport system permease protein